MDEKKKAPGYSKWTEEDETDLVALKATDFDLKETQLGRLEAARKKEFEGSIIRISKEDRLQYIEMLKDMPNNGETTAEV